MIFNKIIAGLSTVILITGCARQSVTGATPSQPIPSPTTVDSSVPRQPVEPGTMPSQAPNSGSVRSWRFSYTPGTYGYTITTEARVYPITDTTNVRAIPSVVQAVTLNVMTDGATQLVNPVPITTSAVVCDSTAALALRAARIVPVLPDSLITGYTWTDSAVVTGCRGFIPTMSTVSYTYTVVGDTVYEGIKALLLKRAETITATGEGSEGQHRILVSAVGAGNTDLFFDPAGGWFLGSVSEQTTQLNVTTSGRLGQFRQRVRERVTLAR